MKYIHLIAYNTLGGYGRAPVTKHIDFALGNIHNRWDKQKFTLISSGQGMQAYEVRCQNLVKVFRFQSLLVFRIMEKKLQNECIISVQMDYSDYVFYSRTVKGVLKYLLQKEIWGVMQLGIIDGAEETQTSK